MNEIKLPHSGSMETGIPKFFKTVDEIQRQYDEMMRASGYVVVRQFLGNGKYARRYLPENYQLRVDEEVVE